MSHEAINNQPPAPVIDEAVVKQWMETSDSRNEYGQTVQIDRGNGPEDVIFEDALPLRSKIQGEASTPIVVITNPDGSRENIPTASFLEWTKFDPSTLETAEADQPLQEEALAFIGHAAVEPLSNYEAERRARRAERAEKLFAVPEQLKEKADEPGPTIDQFRALLDPNAEPDTSNFPRYSASRERLPRPPEDEDIAAAASELQFAMQHDSTLETIVRKHISERVPYREQVKLLQTNAELRKEVGVYLLDKMDHADVWRRMPERIARDTQKNPNHPGYGRLNYVSSREYACMLAMSMMDGTYDISTAKGDEITAGRGNYGGVGQHRAAAKILLEYSDEQWSPTLKQTVNIWDK